MPSPLSRLLPVLALFAAAGPALGQRNDAANAPFRAPARIGTLPLQTVPEASGIVRSRRHADVFWTHNDSDGTAEVFAVRGNGTLLRRVVVPGAKQVDWEDIALDEQDRLVVGDLGDNFAAHREHALYRFAEPDPHGTAAVDRVETFRWRYPAECGALDAEALWVAGDFAFVLTKEPRAARLFRIELSAKAAAAREPVQAELLGTLDGLQQVTGACLSAERRQLAVLTYFEVVVFDLAEPLQADLPATALLGALHEAKRRTQAVMLGQCEGITWDGHDLVVATERGPVRWGRPLLWRLVPK